MPVEVEVDERGAPRPLEADDARRLRAFDERAVGVADQEVVRVAGGVVGLRLDVALADEQVEEAVVVDVLELGVPRRRREHVATRERAVGGDARARARCPGTSVGPAPSASVWSLLSPWLVMNTSG